MALEMKKLDIPDFEDVYHVQDSVSGLEAIIAIHSTQRGPSLGGVRVHGYENFEEALQDALRLSKGMTDKSSFANVPVGGGKAVIIHEGPAPKEILRKFGEAVQSLEGRYFTAEDVGINQEGLGYIREKTPYVVGVDADKNPCPYTAWGTFRGIQATIHALTGSSSLEGKTVAIQGLGHVGMILSDLLFWQGANLIVSDLCAEKTKTAKNLYNAEIVDVQEIHKVSCDIFSPCAMGGILNAETIKELDCLGVAGCANNQLEKATDAILLKQRNILYAPDYVINGGGLIMVFHEICPSGFDPKEARKSVDNIFAHLQKVYTLARELNCDTQTAALEWVKTKQMEPSYVLSPCS